MVKIKKYLKSLQERDLLWRTLSSPPHIFSSSFSTIPSSSHPWKTRELLLRFFHFIHLFIFNLNIEATPTEKNLGDPILHGHRTRPPSQSRWSSIPEQHDTKVHQQITIYSYLNGDLLLNANECVCEECLYSNKNMIKQVCGLQDVWVEKLLVMTVQL